MIAILATTFAILCFPICNAMSPHEATFRCQTSIENAEAHYSKLESADLKRIAKTALSIMQKILKELSKGSLKDLPTLTKQCIQHEEHAAWLSNSIAPAMKTAKETKAPASQTSDLEQKNNRSKKQKQKEKIIQINQQNFNPKDLEKMLESEEDSKLSDTSKLSASLTPSL